MLKERKKADICKSELKMSVVIMYILFYGKNYTAGSNFTLPPVVPNLNPEPEDLANKEL